MYSNWAAKHTYTGCNSVALPLKPTVWTYRLEWIISANVKWVLVLWSNEFRELFTKSVAPTAGRLYTQCVPEMRTWEWNVLCFCVRIKGGVWEWESWGLRVRVRPGVCVTTKNCRSWIGFFYITPPVHNIHMESRKLRSAAPILLTEKRKSVFLSTKNCRAHRIKP